VPFGLYHYTGVSRGQELYLDNVPFFDPLSFAFLAFASLGVARLLVAGPGAQRGRTAGPWPMALLTGLLMTWLDVVIDPLAVRGDRWFLGRVFYYPVPGWYFGVPVANFGGWLVLGTAIARLWLWLEPRLTGPAPGWARRCPVLRAGPLLLYYGVLVFNLTVTARVGEPALFWSGVAVHLPLAALVVSFLSTRVRRSSA
jgi:putative membrane protein